MSNTVAAGISFHLHARGELAAERRQEEDTALSIAGHVLTEWGRAWLPRQRPPVAQDHHPEQDQPRGTAAMSTDQPVPSTTQPAKKPSVLTRILVVVGVVALVVVGLRVANAIYDKVTEDDRWLEQSASSCSLIISLQGGQAPIEKMSAAKAGMFGDLPSYRVDGGQLNNRLVYCLNYVKPTDRTVGASTLFYTDGTKV